MLAHQEEKTNKKEGTYEADMRDKVQTEMN